jgi:hypothetical protein
MSTLTLIEIVNEEIECTIFNENTESITLCFRSPEMVEEFCDDLLEAARALREMLLAEQLPKNKVN